MIPSRTESLHFFVLVNSATKSLRVLQRGLGFSAPNPKP